VPLISEFSLFIIHVFRVFPSSSPHLSSISLSHTFLARNIPAAAPPQKSDHCQQQTSKKENCAEQKNFNVLNFKNVKAEAFPSSLPLG